MKRIFTSLFFIFLFGLSSFAQRSYVNYDRDSKWFVGINAGATWHSRTEVDNLLGPGYGFTFGRSFGMKPEKLFSWDLRFRYLHGWWGGQNTVATVLDSSSVSTLPTIYPQNTMQTYADSGGFIPNFRTQLISGSLELALNTNRLRQNTGWNFQIFGGIGIKGYEASTDLVDGSGNIYDYSTAGTSKTELQDFRDGVYETTNGFEVDWAGSFGAGISYQVTPWASIGLSHKMTWVRDNNKFDLTPFDVGAVNTGNNDIYHYSSAGIRFHLLGGATTTPVDDFAEDTVNINNFDTVDEEVITPPVQRPIVDIYDPGVSPYTVETNTFYLQAYVHHVDGRQNITFKQNGKINNNYTYHPATDQFASSVVLQPGQNIFEITGVNDAGQDYESTIIIFKPEEPIIEPPIVTITNPPYSPYTVNNGTFNFASTVLNVDSKSQIKVYFNGQYLPNFTYSTSSKDLYATLNLQEGTNTVTVTATNDAGSDSKTAKIIYEKPIERQPPVVNFVNPSIDPYTTNQAHKNITATVLNVDGKNDIKVKVNGNTITNFTYNMSTKYVNFNVALQEGANVLEITGTNEVGTDWDNTTIIYKKPETPKPPVVTFIDPVVDPLTVYTPTYNVRAEVLNVNSASDITLKINGVQSYNFTYSPSSKQMNFTTNLQLGSNVIEITGTNQWGSDMEATTIIYKRVVPQAPPVVNITYPSVDNEVFHTPNLTLSASVLNVSSAANINVLINGNSTNAFTYNTATKILYLPLTLIEGTNTVVITGTNSAGTDSDTRLIIYEKPVEPAPPTVDFVNPPTSPYVVSNENYTITANTTNIETKNQISLLHNGNLIPDAQYIFTSSHQIIYHSQLIPGSNIFEIIVTNVDGTDDEMAIVTYQIDEEPCIIPTVGYISPVPYSTVNDPNVTIDAQINNHTPGTTVEMLLNGVSKGFMSYNANTSIASLATVLESGLNAITVIVTNDCGTNQATFTLNYEQPLAPCLDPVLVANGDINSTTQNSTATVQAGVTDVSSASNITVTVNGNPANFTFDQGTNTITALNVPLSLGNNAIVITATNDCGTATLTYHVLRKECNLPTITSASHQTGFISPDYSIQFNATVSNAASSDIVLLINGVSQPFNFDNQTGLVSAGINLNEGNNTVVLTATNPCGTTSETYVFTHKIPCVPITYSLLSPSANTTTVTDPNYNVLVHVTGTIEASGITATLNGAVVNFNFDPIAGNISINGMTLVDGNNAVVITLNNDCSSEEIRLNINYDGCQPPTISISSLVDGAVVNTSSAHLVATVTNSNGAGNIVLTVNGTSQSFDFNDQTNVLTADLALNEGDNTVTLTVNGCEPATQTIKVTYEVPCTPISYSLISPAANTDQVLYENYQISLSLLQVANAQQIHVEHNGNIHPFNFDEGTSILTIDGITLVDGPNTITVQAQNDCSNETITYNVTYDGCKPPVITLGSNATAVTAETYTFTASVTNISNQNEIQVLHNNAPVNFVFQNGNISADITLIEGANTIVVNANGCETDSKSHTVTYTIPCDLIVYSLATPAQNATSVADENFTLTLVAQHADPASITVTANGATVQHTYVNDLITANIVLVDGANNIAVTMSNACSNETINYTIQHDGCDAPVINITGNADAVTEATYDFEIHIQNVSDKNQITFTLNGAPTPFSYDAVSGELLAQLLLTEGANTIAVSANTCDAASATFNVTYTIPCNPVTYSLGSPTTMNSVIEGNETSITLNAQHVPSPQNITATINSNPLPFTFSNNVIQANNIPLAEGTNTVVFTFGNDCSSETVTYIIESDQCPDPAIITVTGSSVVTDPLHTFTANIQNVNDPNDLVVTINGTVVPHTFANGVLTSQMSLNLGSNDVTVTAQGCETTSITYQVIYELPCNPITFTHHTPANNDTIFTENTSQMLKIMAQNVDAQGVSATLNGNTVNATFFGGSVQVIANNLQVGHNTVIMHLVNDCSTSDAIFHIVVGEPCVAPTITINSPTTSSAASYTLNANVTGVANQNAIVVKLNNTSVPFTYNNGTVTANLTLNQGANAIVIEAAGCESVNGSTTVTYTVPCDAVTYSYGSPSSNSATVTDPNYSITLNTQHIDNPSFVSATLNGSALVPAFNQQNGQINLNGLTLVEGNNTIVVTFSNQCSNETVTYNITYNAPGPCGPRFNPGNSDWQFCLVTPSGTYNRDDLAANPAFTYSGPASSVFFKPIAGGGDAVVNGQPYQVSNGQYYLFQGNLTVDVGSNHPGSMGHWEICLTSDSNPTYGNGNNRPTSPCEAQNTQPDFNIDPNGGVDVNNAVCANIQCLGESVVYNNYQDAFVNLEYSIDGGSTWYYFNGNNFVNGGENVQVAVPAGGEIVLKAKCENANGNWNNVETSNTGSQYVYVLKDGDQAPNFAPAQGQASVETFLAGYVDNQGNVTLGPNDVIYLFELRFVGNYGIDYQDCVMLITMDDNPSCPAPNPSDEVGKANTGSGQTWDPPVITNVNPAQSAVTVEKDAYAFKANIKNINDPQDAVLYFNGQAFKGAQFNLTSGQLTANLKLKEGANTIKVDAKNGNQTRSANYTITYKQGLGTVAVKPTITNVNPKTTSAKVGNTTYNFKASVSGVKSRQDIQMYVNGALYHTFTYSLTTKQVSAVLRLKNGSNSIKLVATNGNEKAERTYAVTVTQVTSNVQAPVITNISPSGTSVTAKSHSYNFKASVSGVKGKNDIKLYLNGVAMNSFTYSTSSKQVFAVLKLRNGKNSVKLVATNSGKKAERTYTIMVPTNTNTNTNTGMGTNNGNTNTNTNNNTTTVKKPVITPIAPKYSGEVVTKSSYAFKAKVTNVTTKSSIKLYVNGRLVSFSFSGGQVSANLALKNGSNSIKIQAGTGSSAVTKSFTVTYKAPISKPNTNSGGTKPNNTNTNGGTKTTNGGSTNTNNGGTKTTNGGTKTTNGGTKTTNGGTKTTNGGTKTTNGGTTTNGGSRKIGG